MRRTDPLSSKQGKRGKAMLGRPLILAVLIAAAAAPAIAQAQTAVAAAPAPAATGPSAPTNGVGSAFELTFWQSVASTDDPAAFDAYLVQYPAGTFSGLARARIAALQRAQTMLPAAPPPVTQLAVPSQVAAVVSAPEAAPALAPSPAVLTAMAPPQAAAAASGAPALAAAQTAVITTTPAALAAAEPNAPSGRAAPSSPLSRLLAQLRGTGDAAGAAPAAAHVTPAPPVHPALGAQAPSAQPQTYTPAGVPMAAAAAAPAPALVAAAPVANYASARPVLLPVPDVAMPGYFCGTDARNAFHNATYRPAVEAATRNNEAAVTYLRQLQQTYDRGQLGRDTAVLNAIAAEARAYQAEAARAYSAQAGLVRQFDALMAVPLRVCSSGTQ